MFSLLGFLWLIRETKSLLFYIYLWQLKEYHFGRFLAHFSTAKGKRLLWNKAIFGKFASFIVFLLLAVFSSKFTGFLAFLNPYGYYAQALAVPILLLYFGEAIRIIKNIIFKKRIKAPIFTEKTTLLVSSGFFLELLFIFVLFAKIKSAYWFTASILFFDAFSLFIFSALVLLFQPLTVLLRKKIIKKATQKRQEFKDLLVVGITGSYGKTSTKEFLATILSEKFYVLKTEEHQNSEMGISQCILNQLEKGHQVFICEMGAYKRGGIKLLADIIKPKYGILTGINEQHMATFGSQEKIIKTKYELIESLPQNGLAVFNGNNNYCYGLYQKTQKPKKISYVKYSETKSEGVKPDIWAEEIVIVKEFVYFKAVTKDGDSGQFKVNLPGEKNIENILMAILIAKELGMSMIEISNACQKIRPWQGAMLLKKLDGLNVIDATYSANPDGVIAHLDHLKLWKGRRMIVMPCLIELGKAAKEVHRKIGKKIGEICDLAIITAEDYVKEIKQGAVGTKINPKRILFMEDSKEIFKIIKKLNGREDVVLLESRVPREIIGLLASR